MDFDERAGRGRSHPAELLPMPLSTFGGASMKKAIVLSLLCLCASGSWAGAPAILLSAYATSRSPDSTGPLCLLDPECRGRWTPGSKDAGVNDGLYYQFENPVRVDYILVRFKNSASSPGYPSWPVRFYIDGKTTSARKAVYRQEPADSHTMRIGIRREEGVGPMGARMKSFFLCIDPAFEP